MVIRLLPHTSYASMPWKNGGGTTHEIARHPAAGEFEWRLSIADVSSSGPFSTFPSIDRWIVVIEGAGMRLRRPEGIIELHPLQPFAFDGDSGTSGELIAGSVRDLNLMVRRGWAEGSLTVITLAATPHSIMIDRGVTFLYAIQPVTIHADDRVIEVDAGDTLRVDADSSEPGRIEMSGESGATIVRAFIGVKKPG